ncbi:MAG TPA: SDR family oxidoreductase, partial [Dongiaceae bacterium]|nr:SDR family oxidoreductase [Dongiaceae bacterium]
MSASAAIPRRAVVTGAASGIGLAVARRLRREGAKVLAADIDEKRLSAAAELGCETMAVDLAEPAARDRLAKAAEGIDYLVNAAGIIRIKPIFEVTVEDWRKVLTVNTEAIFFLCKAIGPRMRPE